MSTHLENVLMQQSYGPKSTMPTSRPTGELLLALNEFNKYELYTGTDTGVQPLISDGYGNSNVSFTVNQDSADALNGKFVYFDNATSTWKPAYASAVPPQGDHFTAQGFAISMNSTGIQVTTSGKLIIPFRLTDYTGASVVAGSYYYLCQTEANAGMIQQAAPASGIMQIVCQIIAVDDNSTTMLLLNDLSQVANDIIVTNGDGSKYLGDDGQYHDMMVAGLAGRTSNCLDTYEVLDINFENIAAGRSAATAYTFPTLTANGTWDDATAAAAIAGSGYDSEGTAVAFSPTTIFNITAGTNQVFTAAGSVASDFTWKFLQATYLTTITFINHTDAAQTNSNVHTAIIVYADTLSGTWTNTNYTVTVPTNTAGAQYTLEIPLELSKQWGAHKFWRLGQMTNFAGSTETFATNKITPAGYYYTGAATASYGYVANGDITIEDNIASGFSNKNYIISKYLVENYSQYSFRVRKKFDQVTNEDPIWQSPNKTNYLAIENGALKLVLNGLAYKGNLVYEANTWYDFKINYNIESGYVISVSSDNSDEPSWTNEIILYDEVNYLDGTTWYLGVASLMDEYTIGTGQIDLAHTGMDYVNSEQSFETYPLSDATAKNIATITVTFKGTGLTATGRANNTTTLNAQSVDVDTVENTIIAQDTTDLLWNAQTGLTTANYTEVDYLRQYEDSEQNTVVYARDTNQCYSYTIVYPNFLQTNINFETDDGDIKLDLSGANATFHPNTFLNRNGFNFQLKLDLTGNLVLDRTLDARNYGGTKPFPFYYEVQGVDWSTFQDDGGYVKGIKISSALGSTNTGTANGSLYQLTVNTTNFADASYASQNACGPVFYYFAFEKPINFTSIAFRNYSYVNYIPVQYCLHVSNDMNTWESILPSTAAGYVSNGMFGNLPIDAYANFPNRTVDVIHNAAVTMPDSNQYYKYVRIGAFMGATNTYRPVLSGCWIGMSGTSTTDFATNTQTARELIFEKQNFINTETSGINAQVVRKKTGTAYQVRFLDKIGYVETPPEEGVTDITGKQLAKNDEEIYKDERLQNQITTQRLAYQTHCPVFLNEERDYSVPVAGNPCANNSSWMMYRGTANTGTVADSFNLLQSTTTGYDFANGLNASSFIITFTNKAFVDYFYIQNNATVTYNPQQVKVYGSVNGGSFTGTFGDNSGEDDEVVSPEADWEEIPILNMVTAYNNGDFEHFAPTEQMNTYVETASTQAITRSGTIVADDTYGAFNLYIAPKKAYQQYRIEVQRTVNNRVIETTIQPKGVWYDPWATPLKNDGTNAPLIVSQGYYPSSSATVLSDKSTLKTAMYASSYSPTTVYQLYGSGDNGNWTPEDSRRYVTLQQAYPYTVNMNSMRVQHGNDLNYAANLFEYFGTTNTDLATTALSNTNSLMDWSRITSLIDKADIPTAIGTTAKNNVLFLGDKEYGYNYFTALFRRSINNQIYMDSFIPVLHNYADASATTATSNYLNTSKYTEEWKWTNVAGEKDEIREAACYNHPLLITGDTKSLTPSYELSKREDDAKYYTETENTEGNYLPNNTSVYRTTSMVANKTFPYENRWMYKFTDSDSNIWYSPTAPTGAAGTLNSYMYKNIIPKYNTEVYTGIPMTATANTGSTNGYTYFDQSLTARPSDAIDAWNAFSSTLQTIDNSWCSGAAFDSTTGLCTEADRDIYVGFQAPEAITVQGYTIKGTSGTSQLGIAQWELQASNNGTEWTTIDTRDTEAAENPDAPVNMDCGTSYFFNNEDSYTYYRWLIKKVTPGANFCRLQVPCLYVLEENPVKVYSIFELTYTDSQSVQHTAYTNASGTQGSFADNNETIYSDVNLLEPITNVWAYQVSDGTHQYYTKVAGDADTYAPETTMIYEDFDFNTEFGEALVDTWQYTGVINKKYEYTGTQINNFTWDGEEPYNKYFYTGNVANQYKYTGKIEGWTYTGVTKDIYDVVPNFHLSLNRDDARKIQKATLLGNAYPVATSTTSLATTAYWSFTSNDVAGTAVPSGTPLYSQLTDTEPSATADGTQSYVFGSQPSQSRYDYSYLYTSWNDLPEGQSLTGDEQAYQDADLTIAAPEDTDLTQYTYTNDYEASHMTDFYHRITEDTPCQDYNFGLQFDGSKYTFTNYIDNGTVDSQEFVDGTLVKSSYNGPDESLRNRSVIMMTQQDLLKLNLTKSVYSWWTWNNLYEQQITRTPVSIFRLATIDGSSASIEDIYELYPWRVGDVSTGDMTAIGDPIITLSNELKSNEIWLEGQTLEIAKYRKLFKVYGTAWGGDGTTTFGVPDFRNRAIWGSGDGTFGYIEAGLPDITVSMASAGAHTHTRGTMNITAGAIVWTYPNAVSNGAFRVNTSQTGWGVAGGNEHKPVRSASLSAASNWTGSTSSNGAHTHTLTVTKDASVYGNSSTVQPNALKIRIKTKAK